MLKKFSIIFFVIATQTSFAQNAKMKSFVNGLMKKMTLDEKITLLHGTGHPGLGPMSPLSSGSNGGAGYVVGIPRLGIPGIQMSDAAYGVRASGQNGRYSTALPCNLAAAASWNMDAAYEYGALIGRELRAQGFNMSLGGGVDITREPRNGRNFEYLATTGRVSFRGHPAPEIQRNVPLRECVQLEVQAGTGLVVLR